MKYFCRFILTACTLLLLAGCSQEKVSEMTTGRWANQAGTEIVLIDLPRGMFSILSMTRNGPFPVLSAENLKIEKEEADPEQVTFSYDFGGQRQKTILRIIWADNSHYNLALVNSLTGRSMPLRFVSEKPTLE